MQKETVFATVRTEIDLSEEMRSFLSQFKGRPNAWFAGGVVSAGTSSAQESLGARKGGERIGWAAV
jgi:hypothetical protein